MEPMKECFLRDMRFVWPEGLVIPGEERQHKDLVRTYAMGWVSAMMYLERRDEVGTWVDEYRRLMGDPNWWPDASWRWW